jgi:hypothetical protein
MGQRLTYLLLVVLAGCTTNPQPFPIPGPDVEKVFMSLASLGGSSEVAGLPGAASADVDEIVVLNPSRKIEVRVPAHADGSFVLELAWSSGEPLLMWAERDGARSDRVAVQLPPTLKSKRLDPTVNVTSPAGGMVTVSGTVEPGDRVIVGNKTQGAASSALAGASGDYSVAISGAVGDRLAVFAIDLSNRESTAAVEVTVPGP